MSGSRGAAFGLLAVVALAAWTAARLEVTTDVTHFLPGGRDDPAVDLARELALGELSRTLIVVAGADDGTPVPELSRELEAAFRAEPRVADACVAIEGGPPAGFEEALWRLYEPRRFGFVARDPVAARALASDEGLGAALDDLRRRLASPASSLLSRVAPGDPFLTLPRLLERLEASRGDGLDVAEGRFVAEDGARAVLFLTTRAPVSDNAAQRPFLAGLRAAADAVDAAHGGTLALETSGANRYGVRMEESIRADVRRVSIGSTLLLTLLFLALFRSLRLALLVLPVLGTGFLAGVAACLAWFGAVHGITLAFGAALIGVSVDYAVHFHCHHLLAPDPGGPRRTMASIGSALWLGAATTVAGFVALAVSSFPGLRELAVFSAVGIAAALLATRAFLPALAGPAVAPPAAARVARALGRAADPAAPGRRPAQLALGLGLAVLLAVGLPRARWVDDVSALNRLDPELLAEDARVRDAVGGFDAGRLVVALGPTDEAALRVNDRLAEALIELQAEGAVGGAWTAAALLPSAARQRAVDAALRADDTLWPRTRAALEARGFAPAAFEPLRDALAAPAPEPLAWGDLAGSALAPLVRNLRTEVSPDLLDDPAGAERAVAYVGFVREVADEPRLRDRVAAAGGRVVDVEGELSRAYGAYRKRMTTLLGFGALAIGLLVVARYALRPPRTLAATARASATACVPAFLAVAGTVAVVSLAGLPLNMISLVALLMVVSMGVDYGVFLVESTRDRAAYEATLLAVFVAGASTVAGFGLLALSEQPLLRSIGWTSGVGVALCLVLVPALARVRLGEGARA